MALSIIAGQAPASFAQSGGPYDLRSSTIDGGGVTAASGGTYRVAATAGQPDAGAASGASYFLGGGFWGEIAGSGTPSPTPTVTTTAALSATPSPSPTATPKPTASPTASVMATRTPTGASTLVPSATPTTTPTRTTTTTATPTTSATHSPSPTATPTQQVTLPGDADCNSQLDAADIAATGIALFDPIARALCDADCNQDGMVTAADVACVVKLLFTAARQ